ncbi:Arginine--tRNA ligase [Tripterygium wilfordii]|uniref:Arginine--tRNA ligase n=1 Tax=Tripterygium wilfordii TaxID=458696 RepID=A0A7J7DQ95_TRIWF|nr:Arginine--tRNA ligase [Tripterygium wilfordii]
MATDEETEGTVKQLLAQLFEQSLRTTVPDEPDVGPLVAACTAKFGDYQWYASWKYTRWSPFIF